jgi:glycosyltransferase involved in cell wall biosynthesis
MSRGANCAGIGPTTAAELSATGFTGVTVVLPAVTETRSLVETVETILRDCRSDIERFLIVVCDRTTPACLDTARSLQRRHSGLVSISRQVRPFLGGAIRDAFDHVESSHVITMSSDLETDPRAVKALIAAGRVNPGAIVAASRWLEGARLPHGYGWAKWLCNLVFQKFFSLLYRTSLTDMTHGYRIYPTPLVRAIAWQELRHAFLFETLVKPLRLGVPIVEVPAGWRTRVEGKSQNRALNYLDYVRVGIMVRFRRPPAQLPVNGEPLVERFSEAAR